MAYEYLDLLERKLDDRQKKVCCRAENTVVAAGAGSGKTQVLATRFAWLVMSCNIPASKILTLTFTKKAAGEMYDRIYKTLAFFAENPETPAIEKQRARRALENFGETHIQTLDSYCVNIVRQAANRYGIRPDFTAGSADSEREIKDEALPFILKHRNNPAVLNFANAGGIQFFAETIFAETLNQYASIADSDDCFCSKLPLQAEKVCADFNSLVFGKDNLCSLESELEMCLAEMDKNHPEVEKLRPYIFSVEKILNEYKEISFEDDFKYCAPELLELCEGLEAGFSRVNITALKTACRDKEVKELVSSNINAFRELSKKLSAMVAFIRQYPQIKELFSLMDLFHAKIKKSKKISGKLSFRDIQKMALLILQEQSDLRSQENAAYDKIMIDEFQDNNGENRELLFLICSPAESGPHPKAGDISPEKLFFVGDEKQSIYKFRGADVSVFNELQTDFKNYYGKESVLPMEYNYRSDNPLITSFNMIFGGDNGIFPKETNAEYEALYLTETKKYDPQKKLVLLPEKLDSRNVRMHFCVLNKDRLEQEMASDKGNIDMPGENEQGAYFIAKKIDELCKSGVPYKDIAVLDKSRTHRMYLIKWLNIFGIPYSLDQNSSVFASGLVYDIYNFLRICVYPSDLNAYAAFLSSPFAALGWNSVEKILAMQDENLKSVVCEDVELEEKNKEKIKEQLSEQEFKLYTKAQAFLKEKRNLVLSEPLTKTLDFLWNDTGYRYETMLNNRSQLSAEQFDMLYELARQCDCDGKSVAWFVDQLAILRDNENSSFKNDTDLDAQDVTYPLEKEASVQILSIHKSKGLQYDYVFISGCFSLRGRGESGSVFYDDEFGLSVKPKKGSLNYFYLLQQELAQKKELAEFRRLIYVAITRAIHHVYLVGSLAVTQKKQKLDESKVDFMLLKKQLEVYYPEWENPKFGADDVVFKENAPFDYFSIKPIKTEDAYKIIKNQSRISDAQLRNRLGNELLPLYKAAVQIQVEPEDLKRRTPSSLEDSQNAQILAMNKKDAFEDVNAIIEKKCGTCEEPASLKDDPDSAGKTEYDELFTSSVFTYMDFGTLIHSYAEALANKIAPEVFLPESKLFKNLTEAEIQVVKNACIKMIHIFKESPMGKALEDAINSRRFVKPEYAFRTQMDGFLVTGSIDLIFQNKDGTYTLLDYKSDRIIRPSMYYGQQKCYRTSASALLNCDESKIRCYLYFLRYGETLEITENLE